jgi:hypothetical protein
MNIVNEFTQKEFVNLFYNIYDGSEYLQNILVKNPNFITLYHDMYFCHGMPQKNYHP